MLEEMIVEATHQEGIMESNLVLRPSPLKLEVMFIRLIHSVPAWGPRLSHLAQ